MRRYVAVVSAASLLMLGAGCAGPSAEVGSAAGLSGTWHGSMQETAASSGFVLGDITLQIDTDGKYSAAVRIRLVAGSARGSSYRGSGQVVTMGQYVAFEDSSGARVMLVRSGDTLYGVMKDIATPKVVTVLLDKAGNKEGE